MKDFTEPLDRPPVCEVFSSFVLFVEFIVLHINGFVNNFFEKNIKIFKLSELSAVILKNPVI